MLTGKSHAETHKNQRLIDFWPPCWPLRFCQSLASVFGESIKDQHQCYRRRWTRRWSASTARRRAGSRRTRAPWLRWRRGWRARQLWRGTALKLSSSASCFWIISSRKPRSIASLSKEPSTRFCCVANHSILTGFASLNIFLPEQWPAGRVFQYRVGSGRVLDKVPGSGSGSGRVGVSENTIGYFRVSFLLSGISGYFGHFRICRGFLLISGFTYIS